MTCAMLFIHYNFKMNTEVKKNIPGKIFPDYLQITYLEEKHLAWILIQIMSFRYVYLLSDWKVIQRFNRSSALAFGYIVIPFTEQPIDKTVFVIIKKKIPSTIILGPCNNNHRRHFQRNWWYHTIKLYCVGIVLVYSCYHLRYIFLI